MSPAPYVSGSLGLGTSGPIAHTVRDAAALLDVMRGYEPGDFYVAPVPPRPYLDECDEDTAFSFTAHTAPLCDASHAAADRLSGAMKQSDEDVPH